MSNLILTLECQLVMVRQQLAEMRKERDAAIDGHLTEHQAAVDQFSKADNLRDQLLAASAENLRLRTALEKFKTCPKCQAVSGNDWSQCRGQCPLPMSPHFKA